MSAANESVETDLQADPIVIVGAARTPMGGFQGDLAGAKATDLGGAAIKAALDRAGVPAQDVEEVLMGVVLPAGPRPGAGAAGRPRRRRALERPGHHREQDVRLGHEDGHAGL